MTSWRDTTSTQAQADLDGLLDTTLRLVEGALGKDGLFVPFGTAVDEDGDVTVMATEDADDADDALKGLLSAAEELKVDHRAFAFAAEIEAEDAGDDHVVRVELEHSEGVAIAVLARYGRGRLRKLKQKDLRAITGLAHVFTG